MQLTCPACVSCAHPACVQPHSWSGDYLLIQIPLVERVSELCKKLCLSVKNGPDGQSNSLTTTDLRTTSHHQSCVGFTLVHDGNYSMNTASLCWGWGRCVLGEAQWQSRSRKVKPLSPTPKWSCFRVRHQVWSCRAGELVVDWTRLVLANCCCWQSWPLPSLVPPASLTQMIYNNIWQIVILISYDLRRGLGLGCSGLCVFLVEHFICW